MGLPGLAGGGARGAARRGGGLGEAVVVRLGWGLFTPCLVGGCFGWEMGPEGGARDAAAPAPGCCFLRAVAAPPGGCLLLVVLLPPADCWCLFAPGLCS